MQLKENRTASTRQAEVEEGLGPAEKLSWTTRRRVKRGVRTGLIVPRSVDRMFLFVERTYKGQPWPTRAINVQQAEIRLSRQFSRRGLGARTILASRFQEALATPLDRQGLAATEPSKSPSSQVSRSRQTRPSTLSKFHGFSFKD